ncbi:MAG: hypothetical protein K2X47_12560 [Bdellovibrionales bacterium]|nr:hypothetical protein [Bdellovibrionales bacterium]
MKSNLFLTRLTLISMPFLAACSSGSSSGGGAAPIVPMNKTQKASFVSFLKESTKSMEIMSALTPQQNNGGRSPLSDLALSLAGQGSSPQTMASGEYSRLLSQEIAAGKCKVNQGRPTLNSKKETTIKSSISGNTCSFSANYVMVTQAISAKHTVMDAKMEMAIKSPTVIAKSEVNGGSFHVTMSMKSDDQKSMQMAIAMDGTYQTKTYGPVTNALNMSMSLPVDGTSPTLAMTGQYTCKAWNAVFEINAKPGATPTAKLNGEPIDEETQRALTSAFGSVPGGSAPTGQPSSSHP